jgi:hypothetical protein
VKELLKPNNPKNRREFLRDTVLLAGGGLLTGIPLPVSAQTPSTLLQAVPQPDAGELLYNGIRLPKQWPPLIVEDPHNPFVRTSPLPRNPPPVPYLAHPPAVIPIDVGRQLFVDDFLIEQTDLARRYHQAERYAGNPILKPETTLEMGDRLYSKGNRGPSATVFQDGVWFDPQDQLFKLWYNAGVIGVSSKTAYAISRDGLNWERPTLDVLPGTNAVMVWQSQSGHSRDGCAVWLDHFALDPQQRFKAYAFDNIYRKSLDSGGDILTSPDGIHWSIKAQSSAFYEHSDNSTIHYNPFRRKWVYSLRTVRAGRARGYRECDDLIRGARWEKHEMVYWTAADDLDLPDPEIRDKTQLYNLDMVGYESLMLGVFGIHRGPTNEICDKQGSPKITDLTLAYSRDGFHWHRPDRSAFLAATRKAGDWERGYLHSAASVCTIVGDKLYFYYGGWSGEQKPLGAATGTYSGGATGVAFLRRDGFASMEALGKIGTLTTRPITFKGSYLFLNLNVPQGELRVEVLDEAGKVIAPFSADNCIPVSADNTRQRIIWKTKDTLDALSGRPVRLRFLLSNGSLYAFWVSPDASGASYGYVAAGGPGFTGAVDTVGAGENIHTR